MNEADRVIYDTRAAVRRLTDAGFTERQAEAIADENLRVIRHNLAIKGDIEDVRGEVEK